MLSHSGMLEVRQGDGTYVRSEVDPSEIMRCVSMSGLKDHLELFEYCARFLRASEIFTRSSSLLRVAAMTAASASSMY